MIQYKRRDVTQGVEDYTRKPSSMGAKFRSLVYYYPGA
jgi:hypothetical protein